MPSPKLLPTKCHVVSCSFQCSFHASFQCIPVTQCLTSMAPCPSFQLGVEHDFWQSVVVHLTQACSPSELGSCYESLNTDDIGSIQHLHICNMILPFDFKSGFQVAKLQPGKGFDVLSVESGAFYSMQ